jgi:hypothetical protein
MKPPIADWFVRNLQMRAYREYLEREAREFLPDDFLPEEIQIALLTEEVQA